MEIKILQENLIKPLGILNHIVTTKPSLPILSSILLKAENKTVILQATDLNISLDLQIKAEIKEEGKITLPARSFLEFISSLSPQNLNISEKEGKVFVKGEEAQASFVTMGSEEFPKFPEIDEESKFMLKKETLGFLIRKTAFAAAADEGRPVLTGVLLKNEEGKLGMVATDGFRLSEALSTEGTPNKEFGSLIIPSKALVEVERLIGETEEEVTLSKTLDQNQVVFQFGPPINGLLFARLLEAEYPDYKRIIPDSFSLTAKVNSEHLISAVKTAAIFARGNGQTLRLFFDPQKNEILISAKTAEVGEGLAKVSAEIDGKGIEVGFNAKFLLDGVSSISVEQTQIQIKEEV
ncbi:MAG: DNA polymerase III subunit beta, partial [Candidatus Cloacimonetes bacterium]|nr:DNA polymerase III subunit beta [Candidatus Cloacimonadota bacterium]